MRDLEQRRGGADCHEAEAVAQGDAAAEVGVGHGHHAVASAGVVGPQVPRQTESWKIFSVSKNIFSNLITPSPLVFYLVVGPPITMDTRHAYQVYIVTGGFIHLIELRSITCILNTNETQTHDHAVYHLLKCGNCQV